jgi:hypothetical protein
VQDVRGDADGLELSLKGIAARVRARAGSGLQLPVADSGALPHPAAQVGAAEAVSNTLHQWHAGRSRHSMGTPSADPLESRVVLPLRSRSMPRSPLQRRSQNPPAAAAQELAPDSPHQLSTAAKAHRHIFVSQQLRPAPAWQAEASAGAASESLEAAAGMLGAGPGPIAGSELERVSMGASGGSLESSGRGWRAAGAGVAESAAIAADQALAASAHDALLARTASSGACSSRDSLELMEQDTAAGTRPGTGAWSLEPL